MEKLGLLHTARVINTIEEIKTFAKYLEPGDLFILDAMREKAFKRYCEIRTNQILKDLTENKLNVFPIKK